MLIVSAVRSFTIGPCFYIVRPSHRGTMVAICYVRLLQGYVANRLAIAFRHCPSYGLGDLFLSATHFLSSHVMVRQPFSNTVGMRTA